MKIYSYAKVSELERVISSIHDEKDLRFVVPSRNDKILFPVSSNNNLWTWQDIYEDVSTSSRKRVLSPPDHFLILNVILKNVINDFRDKVKNLPGIDRPGFRSIISDDIRELLNEAVKPEQLINNPESDNPSEFLLPEVYSRYIKSLDNYNLLDSAQVYSEALREIINNQDWGKTYTIIFTGFMSFNHAQLELLRALEDRCREIIILKPEVNMKNFHDADVQFGFSPLVHSEIHNSRADTQNFHAPYVELGFALSVHNSSITSNSKSHEAGKILEIPSAEHGLEPEIIARTLALWSQEKFLHDEKFPGFDAIGLMISSGREDEFAESFERYGVKFDFMSGINISQTLPGKILASIRNLQLRRFPTYETAMLLTQPCFAGSKFPVMRAYRAGYSGLDNWENYLSSGNEDDKDAKTYTDALCAIREIRKFCDALAGKKTPLRIMEAFHEFLTAPGLWLNKEDKIADFPELDETKRLTAEAIRLIGEKVTSLNELMPDLGAVQDEKFSNDEAYEYLEEWCRNTNVRAPLQVSDAVRIYTKQPPVLASFPVWIMSSVTQKTWSESITSSPLLSNSERENLHMPTISDKAAQREALFRRLIQTGENLTIISRPELDNEGRPVLESPFMKRFLDDLPDWKREKFSSEGIKILVGNDGFTFSKIDAGEKITRYVPKVHKSANAVGASDIHELLSCPFLWYQKRQANLYEETSEITSPAEWGSMLHKFWECVWRRYREDMSAPGRNFVKIANDEWQKLTGGEDENYEKFHKLVKDFRLKRRLKGIKFRVDRLSMIQANILDELHSQGYVHEKILLEDEAHLKLKLDGVTFLGQCDRIELLRDAYGQELAFIVDYKEGIGENYEAGMKIANYFWNSDQREKFNHGLQLSVYAALFGAEKLSGVYILGLEDGKISGSFASDTKPIFEQYKSGKFNEKLSDRIEEGEYAMKCAVEVLKKKEFTPEYKSDLCKYCHIKSLCRKGEFRGEILQDNDDDE